MKSQRAKALLLAFALLIIPISVAQLPQPTGYVNDFAGVLTDKQLLENELRLYEQNTTVEVVLVTLAGLPADHTLFSYGVELFDQWNIGKKGEDNGLLVLINTNGAPGNRMRIEIGYGLEGYITDAEAGRILDNALPYYEEGDYQTAAVIILGELSDELAGYVPGPRPSSRDFIGSDGIAFILIPFFYGIITPNASLAIIVIIVVIAVASAAMRNRCPYCIKGRLKCSGDSCVCSRCGRKVTRRRRYAPVIVGGGWHSSGGGFGGFGGGSSGGGGAGR